MARAGYCHDCQAYVYLDDAWRCPAGHAPERVNAWYDPETGQAITPPSAGPPAAPATPPPAAPEPAVVPTAPAAEPAPGPSAAPAPAPSAAAEGRDTVLQAIMAAFAQYPGYAVAYEPGTDIAIHNVVADGSYGSGVKKVEFEAILKAVEQERTVYYWEMLKEKGAGMSLGGFESESYSTFGTKRSGTKKEVLVGPGGSVAWDWDYAKTRQIVEAVAAQHGWKVKTVLRKGAAQW
jgi:hypothetical protein